MTDEHALDRTARLISMDIFAGKASVGQVIDGLLGTTVQLRADRTNLSSPNGQTALCVLFSQIAMMGIGIDLNIPEVPLLVPQPPLKGDHLRSALLDYANDLIPGSRCGIGFGNADLSLALGDSVVDVPRVVRVTGDDWSCAIGPAGQTPPWPWEGTWPIGAMLAAASAAPEALRVALERITSVTGYEPTAEFHTRPGRLARIDLRSRAFSARPLDLGHVDVISGGAITNATIYALLRIPGLSAFMRVLDPETLDITNLNRYPLARRSDEGKAKPIILEYYSRDKVEISGIPNRFDDSWSDLLGRLAPRVLVGVDQIPARWAVQRAAPEWLQVSGTSHFFVMSSSHQPSGPCAGCAHPKDEQGDDPIPTISFVSLWAGILQAIDLLGEVSGEDSAGYYTMCYPLGLSGTRPLIRGKLSPAAECPVQCRAAESRHAPATRRP